MLNIKHVKLTSNFIMIKKNTNKVKIKDKTCYY